MDEGAYNWAKDTYYKVVAVKNDIRNFYNATINKIEQLWADTRDLVLGVDPNKISHDVVSEVTDLDHCKDLPSELDTIMDNLWNKTGLNDSSLPDDVKTAIKGVNFSSLNITGIDPETPDLTMDDLYFYRRNTITPLNALSNVATGYYKISFMIGSALSVNCENAAALALAKKSKANTEKSLKEVLIARIHTDLSSQESKNLEFKLPNSAGGYLEDVGATVTDMVSNFETLGIYVSYKTTRDLADGDQELASGNYMEAYDSYKKAYKRLSEMKDR